MGKGSPSTGSVFDFKPGTLQVDKPNDGVLGQPLSPAPAAASPFSTIGSTASSGLSKGGRREAAPLDFTDDGGIDIEINPAPDPRSFVGEPAAAAPSPPPATQGGVFRSLGITPALREVPDAPSGFSSLIRGVAESDAPAQSSGFGKGGTRGGSNFGRFGSRGFSKGARGYSQGGSLARSLVSLVGRQPEFQAQLANSSIPNAQQAFNTIYGVPMPEGQAQPSTIAPIISVPIPMASLGDRVVPPPSEPQQVADYDYLLNTLKPTPIYPGASFANVGLEGYNTLENIEENQGLSPFDQSQRSMITGTTTGQLSQATANPGNQEEGLANLEDTLGAMS